MTPLTVESTIARIVAQEPRAEAALAALGIDNCCGAQATLREHCQRLGLDPERVLEEVTSAAPARPAPGGCACSRGRRA